MLEITADWIGTRFITHFTESLAEAIGETDIDIEAVVLDSGLIDLVALSVEQR
jgi:hypothetical protein